MEETRAQQILSCVTADGRKTSPFHRVHVSVRPGPTARRCRAFSYLEVRLRSTNLEPRGACVRVCVCFTRLHVYNTTFPLSILGRPVRACSVSLHRLRAVCPVAQSVLHLCQPQRSSCHGEQCFASIGRLHSVIHEYVKRSPEHK